MFSITGLKISGFKSFADRTIIPIEKGLTGIVGPNGCGKSNILEAFRWLMGETSAKQLRGGSMEDVIFAGTQNRAQSNVASVTMNLDIDSNITLPIAGFEGQNQLEITRRIERNKGSIWKVNHKNLRAKDIRLLFADASSGSRSASIVSQGQISNIIQQEGISIRTLIEDAAGISGLTPRRNEALQRLERTRTNLVEIAHLLELEQTKLASYEKDVKQLKKYKDLSLRIEDLERGFYALSFKQILQNHEDLLALTKEQTSRKQALSHKIITLNKEMTLLEAEKISLEQSTDKALMHIQQQEATLVKYTEQEQQHLRDLQQNKAQQEQLRKDLDNFDAHSEKQQQEYALNCQKLKEKQEYVKIFQQQGEQNQHILKQSEASFVDLEQQYIKLKEEHHIWQGQVKTLDALRIQYEKQYARNQSKHQEFMAQNVDNKDFTADIKNQETIIHKAQKDITTYEDQQKAQKAIIQKQQKTVEDCMESERKSLLQLQSLSTEEQSLKRLLSNYKNSDNQILNMLSIPQQWIKAILAALQAKARLPLLETYDEATPYWRADFASITQDDAHKSWEELTCLAQILPDAPIWLQRRLQHGFIAPNDDFAFSNQHKLLSGQYFVSLDGKMWSWDGTIYPNFDAGAAELLMQRQRLSEIEGDLKQLQQHHAQNKQQLETQQQILKEQQTQLYQHAQKLQNLQKIQQQAKDAVTNLTAQQQIQAAKIENHQKQLQISHNDMQEAQIALQQAIKELQHQQNQEPPLDGLAQRYEKAKSDFTQQQSQAQQNTQKLSNLSQEITYLQTLLTHLDNDAKQHMGRKETLLQRLADMEESYTQLSKQRIDSSQKEQLTAQIAQAKQSYYDQQQKREEVLLHIQKLSYQSENLQKQRTKTEQNLSELEQKLQQRQQQLQHLHDVIEQQFDLSGVQLLQQIDLSAYDKDLRKIENEIIHCKGRREGLGVIDFNSAKKLEEQQKIIEELIHNQDDLNQALDKLQKAIDNLDADARKKLITAFDNVHHHFERIFKLLFGGGQCHLTWTGSHDPLQAGIAIMASPPNKKLQLLSLLSGGEQTLTAIALLFAVFSCRPAPICILDEVDAPLDDHNVERLCALLENMAGQLNTKFLIITHHRITMAKMDRLFGITMMERGVSRFVSVNLKQAESMVEDNNG